MTRNDKKNLCNDMIKYYSFNFIDDYFTSVNIILGNSIELLDDIKKNDKDRFDKLYDTLYSISLKIKDLK